MDKAARLEARALAAGYRGRAVVEQVSFSLERGQILALVGPNGAGKSTLLKTLTGQLPPVSGQVLLEGRPLSSFSRLEQARRMAVLLTERVHPEMMTGFDVAAMGRYPYTGRFGILEKEDRKRVREALERVNASDLAGCGFSEMSDGQRQRILLARALCQEPEVLALDEPTSFLDLRHKADLLGTLVREAREKGTAVVLSLHEIDLAEKVADLVLWVRDGQAGPPDKPERVLTDAFVERLYGLEAGAFPVSRGSLELPRPKGPARVFVIGGAGTGLVHYRQLQKASIPFMAGILYENDLEYAVARALASDVIGARAFEPIPQEVLDRAAEAMLSCGAVLDCRAPQGSLNRANAEILALARKKTVPIVFSTGELQ